MSALLIDPQPRILAKGLAFKPANSRLSGVLSV
jgi:hypothetical protein